MERPLMREQQPRENNQRANTGRRMLDDLFQQDNSSQNRPQPVFPNSRNNRQSENIGGEINNRIDQQRALRQMPNREQNVNGNAPLQPRAIPGVQRPVNLRSRL
jgi:hypothetical protein